MSAPIKADTFEISKLKFEQVNRNKRGGQSIKIGYADVRGAVRILTPPMYVPFGLSVFSEEDSEKISTSLECSFVGWSDDPSEIDPKSSKFFNMMQDIDKAVFNHCCENSIECFGKDMRDKREVLEEFFRKIVKDGKPKREGKGTWPPQMRVKVSPLTPPKLFDAAKNELQWESEPLKYARHTVQMVLQLQPVWFVNKRMFGWSLRLHQMMIVDAPVTDDGCMFVDDDAPITRAITYADDDGDEFDADV